MVELRRVTVGAVVIMTLLGLGACGRDTGSVASSSRPASASTDVGLTVTPVMDLPGARRVQVTDRVSIEVPATMTSTPETSGDVTALSVYLPGGSRAVASVVVAPANDVDDADVKDVARASMAKVASYGTSEEMKFLRIDWAGTPGGWGFTHVLTPSGSEPLDALYVVLRDATGTVLVTVWAQAPRGTLDGSEQRRVLATLQVS